MKRSTMRWRLTGEYAPTRSVGAGSTEPTSDIARVLRLLLLGCEVRLSLRLRLWNVDVSADGSSVRLLLRGRVPGLATLGVDVGGVVVVVMSEHSMPAAEDRKGSAPASRLKLGSAAKRLWMGFCATMMGEACMTNSLLAAEPRSVSSPASACRMGSTATESMAEEGTWSDEGGSAGGDSEEGVEISSARISRSFVPRAGPRGVRDRPSKRRVCGAFAARCVAGCQKSGKNRMFTPKYRMRVTLCSLCLPPSY